MRNNILREDLVAVIEHSKQDDPILTNGIKLMRKDGVIPSNSEAKGMRKSFKGPSEDTSLQLA